MATSDQPSAPARLAHFVARVQSTSIASQPPGRKPRALPQEGAVAAEPVGPLTSATAGSQLPHRWIEGRVLRARKIGGIAHERVKRPPSVARAKVALHQGRASPASDRDSPAPASAPRQKCRSPVRSKCAFRRKTQRETSGAGPDIHHPAVLTSSRRRSISPSVSGRGISARRSLTKHEMAEPCCPTTWLSGSPVARRMTASRNGARSSATGSSDPRRAHADGVHRDSASQMSVPLAERTNSSRGKGGGALVDHRRGCRQAGQAPSCSCWLAILRALTTSSRWPFRTSARLWTDRLIRWSVTRFCG